MGKAAWKDILREIKSSFGRFFAIFGIVAMGVAFFAGVTASSKDMKHSCDLYYDDHNFMDFRLVSTIGFNQDDINAIRDTDGVQGVYAANSVDVLTQVNKQDAVVKVMSLSDNASKEDSSYDSDFINQPWILEGRLPSEPDECVIRKETSRDLPAQIGEMIQLKSGTTTALDETLEHTSYKVVGVIQSPLYVSYDLGTSDIGNGTLSYLIMIGDQEFKSQYDNEVYCTADGAKALNTYSNQYDNLIASLKTELEQTAKRRVNKRIEEIKDRFSEEKSKAELEAYKQIQQNVREQLMAQYASYYPGIDVTYLVDQVYEEAVNRAVGTYDFSTLYKPFEEAQKKALSGSQDWKWYVLDRSMCVSYREYQSSADRMSAIATVFPIFFFFVAALVCLTTMTRMVDEERGLIGIYKALGYSRSVIALKYLFYAFVASITGGILGTLVGLRLFPTVIYNAWGILYKLPPITYDRHIILSIIAVLSMVLVTCISAYYACFHQLAEVPSDLMRPKAPVAGKKILIERIPFLWKKISFSGKVTARNVFRYKKRFFMTVVGVAGCSALLLAGYGIKDSITSLLEKQFGQIQKYDFLVTMKDQEPIAFIVDSVTKNQHITDSYQLTSYSTMTERNEFTVDQDAFMTSSNDKTATISVVPDVSEYQNFVNLRSRNKRTTYELNNNGIAITEKLANDLHVKPGDQIYIQSQSGAVKMVTISYVVEMYVDHYIYMSEMYYNKVFNEKPEMNTLLGILDDKGQTVRENVGEEVLALNGVKSIRFISANMDKFHSMIQSLNSVTYVLILSAAFLAFIVSYNLTNVNISERIREIATIKVLGFYDYEVSAYVFRENIIISIIGALAGLLLGVALHGFIMKTVEMDRIMFGNQINMPSLIKAFVLTIVFSLVVNLIMYQKLKKIPMVESLKSVE